MRSAGEGLPPVPVAASRAGVVEACPLRRDRRHTEPTIAPLQCRHRLPEARQKQSGPRSVSSDEARRYARDGAAWPASCERTCECAPLLLTWHLLSQPVSSRGAGDSFGLTGAWPTHGARRRSARRSEAPPQ